MIATATGLFPGRVLSPDQPGVRFEFTWDIPAWGWALIVLCGVACSAWCYWRIAGSRPWRIALGALRSVTLVLIAVLIAGPMLALRTERTERDWVVFMADRSSSMAVADVGSPAARITRDEQMREGIGSAAEALSRLADERSTLWLGFDAGVFDLDAPGPAGVDWSDPTGRRTELSGPIDQALRRVAARPVSGLVVFSDGRLTSPVSRSTLQRLVADQIPVFVVPVGSDGSLADYAVDRAVAPTRAFVDDTVPVNVRVTRRGGPREGWSGRVRLIDEPTGVVLDERSLDEVADGSDHDELDFSLSARPESAGRVTWTVRLETATPDLTADNNSRAVTLDLTDRPLRVVYFDGYPRWEYRYLRGLVVRERSIRSSTLLLSASRKYLQEGTETLVSIPTSPGDWGGIDVVMIGDVRAELFSTEQMENLKSHIARQGAGLLWIGGPSAMPATWRDSPLGDLLPFTIGRDASGQDSVLVSSEPVVVRPTAAAARLGLLRLGDAADGRWPPWLSDPSTGWARLWWSQRIGPGRVKPTAETLAVMSRDAASDQEWPAVLTMRYGAGRIVYVATDETWRWRHGRGEVLYERFWLPIIRLLARESLGSAGKVALLEASPDRPVVDQPVRVSLRVVDEMVAGQLPSRLTVRALRRTSGGEVRSTDLSLMPEGLRDGKPWSYAATWMPAEAGTYELTATDASLAGSLSDSGPPTASVEVVAPDDERRIPQADHAALAAIAEQTGGAVVSIDRLASLADLLPNRQVRVVGAAQVDPLWDRPIVFAVLLLLLTAEWGGRRWLRLV